jgi:hypothetical protein
MEAYDRAMARAGPRETRDETDHAHWSAHRAGRPRPRPRLPKDHLHDREKVIDIGPLKASVDTQRTIPLPPILGGLALAGGIALVVIGRKRA